MMKLKAKQLIAKLESIVEKYGDLEVAYDSGYGTLYSNDDLYVKEMTERSTGKVIPLIILND